MTKDCHVISPFYTTMATEEVPESAILSELVLKCKKQKVIGFDDRLEYSPRFSGSEGEK